MLGKLKKRLGIKSNFQLFVILIVFSVTGSLSLYVSKFIFTLLGIDSSTSLFIKVPAYIFTVFPSYQILLVIVGTLLGQGRFFINFQKKMLGRFKRNKTDG